MKLSIVKCINGNFSIDSEFVDNEQGAIVKFHQVCAALWNASDVIKANVSILNEVLGTYGNYAEEITHTQPEPEE